MSVPPPPEPFAPDVEELGAGELFYRVGSIERQISSFNPGEGSRTRFAFFGEPLIPVLYAASTEPAALAESLLHDVPIAGGNLLWDDYSRASMGRIRISRPLRLASFRGLGLRRLGVQACQLTDTPASAYAETVLWARAAHATGLDGVIWTSRLCNDARAVVLFGDRAGDAVSQDKSFGRVFTSGPGLDWLIDTCAPLRVNVLPAT